MSPLDALRELGTAPDPEDVDKWLVELGLIRHVVGQSFLGRDLVAYTTKDPNAAGADFHTTNMLYISLVHGNEPTGLLALLSTAEKILSAPHDQPSTNLIFFPFVNIDAYLVNLPISGCRRTNLHINDLCTQAPIAETCPSSTASGVDINRNFPADWEPNLPGGTTYTICSPVHPGPSPFSEPETQAIRTVVTVLHPTHMMSFHSRSDARSGPRLLIHPYGSEIRSFGSMDPFRRAQYQKWNTLLLQDRGDTMKDYDPMYVAGTPADTIGYTARGTTMDWMERVHGVYSYVVEVVPPLEDSRWCEEAEEACWSEVDVHADSAVLWLNSIVGEHNNESQGNGGVNQDPSIISKPTSEESAGLGGTGAIDSSDHRNVTSTVLLSLGLGVIAVAGAIYCFRKCRMAKLCLLHATEPTDSKSKNDENSDSDIL